MPSQSVVVSQRYNPKFDSNKPVNASDNSEELYQVEKTVNTMRVKIGQYLKPFEVQALIKDDINVTIQPVKG
jgi:hypothetical protein